MRTTVDLDDQAMAIARSSAAVRGVSLGAALSYLVRQAAQPPAIPAAGGFPVFSPVPGHVITDELVAQHRDDA